MYVAEYLNVTDLQKMFYRESANKLTKIKKISKKMYLKSEIINSRNDSRKFWSIINSFMPERIKSASTKYLNVNNCKISDSTEIAEHFNKYFCDICKTLADKVHSANSYDYRSYLSDPVSSSMLFRPTFDTEIINITN